MQEFTGMSTMMEELKKYSSRQDVALTVVLKPKMWSIGVAQSNRRGYIPTYIFLSQQREEANRQVEALNNALWPGRSFEDTQRIVLSSMIK